MWRKITPFISGVAQKPYLKTCFSSDFFPIDKTPVLQKFLVNHILGPDHSCCSPLDSLVNPLPLQSVMVDANYNYLGETLLVLSTAISFAFRAIFLVLHPRKIYSTSRSCSKGPVICFLFQAAKAAYSHLNTKLLISPY